MVWRCKGAWLAMSLAVGAYHLVVGNETDRALAKQAGDFCALKLER